MPTRAKSISRTAICTVFAAMLYFSQLSIAGETPRAPIDNNKWFHQTQLPNGNAWFNDEQQHYTNRIDNAFTSNGTLKIVAKKERYTDQGKTKQYTSARLNSKFAFKYGRVEVRAKLPAGHGTWPAIWTLGKNINELGAYWQTQGYGTASWPACGEIDIMEHVGFDPYKVFFSIHNNNLYGNVHGTSQQGVYESNNLETSFHNYAIEWGEDFIRGYIDDILYFDYSKNSNSFNDWPYDNPFFLIINLAIGGEWGGIQGIDNSIFPASFVIDYVRLYIKE